ncbi:MAG TPA: hypothetical protein VGK73_22310 [Polyangiaceae bacterium]
MSRILAILSAAGGLLAVPAEARAQLLGSKGDAIFSAERLFGVRGEHFEAELPAPAPPIDVTETTIAFGFAESLTPYNIPRLGFDYMVIDKLSVGGTLGFSTTSSNVDGPGAGEASPTLFMITPRVGFLHMFGRVAGIWPRGGFSFHTKTVKEGYTYDESGFSLNVECNFPIVFTPHFGVLVGLTFDRSLTANLDPDLGVDYDLTYQSIALQIGLFGWI